MSVSNLSNSSNDTLYVGSLNVLNEANYRFLGASFTIPYNEVVAFPSPQVLYEEDEAISTFATIPVLNGSIIELVANFSVQTTGTFTNNREFVYYFMYSLNGGSFTEIPGYLRFLQRFNYNQEVKNINFSVNIDEFPANIGDELSIIVVVKNINANEITVGSGNVLLIRNWQKF